MSCDNSKFKTQNLKLHKGGVMFRRSIGAFVIVVIAMLALAAPALAGGWAVVTLDSLPREVRAGQPFQLGFVIRQHGRTPVNNDWEGHALKPTLTAQKQGGGQVIQFEAHQQGATGHFVVDITLPSDGMWDWSIAAPPFYIQTTGQRDGSAAIFEPLTVLPAVAAAAAPAEAPPVQAPAAPSILGLNPLVLRWAGVLALIVAGGIALLSRRSRKRAAQVLKA
jgi:hypothetical protein